jgi:hypothetical protein
MLRRLMCPLAAVDRHQQSHHLRRHFVGNFQTFPKRESDQGLNGPCGPLLRFWRKMIFPVHGEISSSRGFNIKLGIFVPTEAVQ